MAKLLIDDAIELLETVHHYGGVNAAADVLGRSPSGISRRLARLSEKLGVPLLSKKGRNVVLTDAGEALMKTAPYLHAADEKARAALSQISDAEAGTIHIAANSFAIATILAPALATWQHQWPKSQWCLSEAEPAHGLMMLARREVDIAVMPQTHIVPAKNDPMYAVVELVKEPIDVILPSEHSLAKLGSIANLNLLANEQWVIGAAWQGGREEILSQCRAAGFVPNEVHYAQDWAAVSALVAAGAGVSLIPRTAPLHNHIARVALVGTNPPERQLSATIRRGTEDRVLIHNSLRLMRDQATGTITEL